LSRNESGRFGALKSDSTHHFFRNACTKSGNKANLLIALVQYPVSQMKMTFQEIRIIATGPCIVNQLRDVNTKCRRSWYITAHVWKIYDFKIEVYHKF
jgi:hypothetical protein